jgi:protein-S-isoprenylcysteine O-methyltransferase Ste14
MISPDIPDRAGIMNERQLRLRGIVFGLIPVILMGAIHFPSAGTIFWPAAWLILLAVFVAVVVVSHTYSTDLVMERTKKQAGAKDGDARQIQLLNLVGLLPFLVAGLDFRFGWTDQIALPVQVGAFVLFFLGYCLLSRAMITNRFFSLVVRVQEEKGHTVITGGPYLFVRHPGYAGFFIIVLAQPAILGSILAIIPAIITAGLIVIRTSREDTTLQAELPGCREFPRQVRYRMVPGIW